MVILPWNTAEEHEQHKGGAYLAVPAAIEPVDDARALGAELERHRGQVLGGLGHDEAPDTAAA